MGIGALIREGLIAYKGQNKYVLLDSKKVNQLNNLSNTHLPHLVKPKGHALVLIFSCKKIGAGFYYCYIKNQQGGVR